MIRPKTTAASGDDYECIGGGGSGDGEPRRYVGVSGERVGGCGLVYLQK